jgi:hypothetical protein
MVAFGEAAPRNHKIWDKRMTLRHNLLTFGLALLVGIILAAYQSTPAAAAEGDAPVLCLPGVYLTQPADCTPAGPSAYLTSMAQQGLRLPLRALPATPADPTLPYSPFQYARLKDGVDVPLYASLDDAAAGRNPTMYIEGGELRYVSYIDTSDTDNSGKPDFFFLRTGVWISAQDVAQRESALIRFQGLSFHDTPRNSFGWIIPLQSYTETKRTPGYAQDDYTGHELVEYSVIQVYAQQEVNGEVWYMIGPDEWVEERKLGIVTPSTTPPDGVSGGRWIEVNLYEQTLAVYEDYRLVFATLIATGAEPYYTRPGRIPDL